MKKHNSQKVVAVLLALGIPGIALAQSGRDPFDLARFASLLDASPTDATLDARGLIDGGLPQPHEALFLDSNGPAGTVDFAFIVPVPANPPVLRGVTLYALAEGGVEDGIGGVSAFRLLASRSAGFPDFVLVDGVNPRDDGSPNTYFFPPVQVSAVYAQFTRSTDSGSRIIELDAISVPEPTGAAALAAGGALLLRRRRQLR